MQRPLTWIQVHLVVQGGTELNRAIAEGTQEFPISQAFSIAGKCDFHHLLSKSINPVDVFCSRVCKERIKHNRITPTGLGRIDTHTQMHRPAQPTLEKVAIVAQMPHLIFWFPYSRRPVSNSAGQKM